MTVNQTLVKGVDYEFSGIGPADTADTYVSMPELARGEHSFIKYSGFLLRTHPQDRLSVYFVAKVGDRTVVSNTVRLVIENSAVKFNPKDNTVTLRGTDRYSEAEYDLDGLLRSLNRSKLIQNASVKLDTASEKIFDAKLDVSSGKLKVGWLNDALSSDRSVAPGRTKTVTVNIWFNGTESFANAKPNISFKLKIKIA